ncbi:MAG: 30S ribosomal protein S28e [Candidatus Micrarchaeia archaeon]
MKEEEKTVGKVEKQFDGYLGEVVEVPRTRTGIFGEAKQIMVRILEGNDKGRVIRRNIVGFVKVGDKIRLPDTTREARQIKAR